MKNVKLITLRDIWADIPHYGRHIDEQVEINAHYSGYLPKQDNDIKTFKKDEGYSYRLILTMTVSVDYLTRLSQN